MTYRWEYPEVQEQQRLLAAFRSLQDHPYFREEPNRVLLAVAEHHGVDPIKLADFAETFNSAHTRGGVVHLRRKG